MPGRTAFAAAAHRAAHQWQQQASLFADPLAMPMLEEDAANILHRAGQNPSERRIRIFIAARTLRGGCPGRGFRSPLGDRLRIFEVDHPATESWKRERLAETAIELPASTRLSRSPIEEKAKRLLT